MGIIYVLGCPGSPPAMNQPPTADAGEDQVVDAGASVTLDGSGSNDPEGNAISFSWEQISGVSVTLLDGSTAMATFTAPDTGAALVFELTVSDGQSSSVATVNVSVRPVETSVQLVEMMQHSVTEDPAVMGDFPNDWLMDVGNDLPQQESEEAELAEFIERFEHSRLAPSGQQDLAPGGTRSISLELAEASRLFASVKWIGTLDPLPVTVALDGATPVTGTSYQMGADRGGSYLNVVASNGGLATLSVTNTSDVTVKIRLLLGSTSFDGE